MTTLDPTSIPEGFKRCRQCAMVLPFDRFTKFTAQKDGLSPTCRDCQRESRKNRADYQAVYRSTHKLQRELYLAKYKVLHSNEIHAQQSRWYYENQEYVKERVRRYHESKPDIARATNRRRKDRIRNLPNNFTTKDWEFCLYYWRGCCAYCGNPPSLFDRDMVLHIEHFIPVTNESCPGTLPTNILPACATCNHNKKNKDAHRWIVGRFGKRRAALIEAQIENYFDSLKEKKR